MIRSLKSLLVLLFVAAFAAAPAWADDYDDAIKVFLNAGESGTYFDTAYGYASSRQSARLASAWAARTARAAST